MIDRTEASRALAKVIAYDNVGKEAEKDYWMTVLFSLLNDGPVIALGASIINQVEVDSDTQ